MGYYPKLFLTDGRSSFGNIPLSLVLLCEGMGRQFRGQFMNKAVDR
jgi:hypothetical protein